MPYFPATGTVTRQDDTVNTTSSQNVTLVGWGYMLGDGTNPYKSEAVTYGVTFAVAPIVVVGALGYRDNSNPAAIGDLAEWDQVIAGGGSVTTTGFNAIIGTRQNGAIANTRRVGYSWIAIGRLA